MSHLVFMTFPIFGILASATSQAIPYSWAKGRNVTAVSERYENYKTAKAQGASAEKLFGVCGKVTDSTQKCTTKIGRPKDSESLACDSFCCLAGYKVGNCGSSYGIKLNWEKIILGLLTSGQPLGALAGLDPYLGANCFCSDDDADIRCGKDGSFWGIRCPFDNSACWRKCCRKGKTGGKCGGFLKFKCKCY